MVYDFDPWMNLWQYLDYRDSPEELRRSARRVGLALAVIHRGEMPRRPVESDPVARRFQAMVAGAETALGRLFERSDVVDRFRNGVRRARDELRGERPRSPAPIHSALGWNRIHYGVDGVFYFFGFEDCHRSDPAIDLGGFAADLLRLALIRDDAAAYRVCCDELLTSYDEKAESPIAPAELPLYVVLALGERLRDARTKAQAEHLLAAMHAAVVLGRHAG